MTRKIPNSDMTYITSDGDRLDVIVFNRYGQNPTHYMERVLEANRGLSKQGVLLESGIKIILPVISNPKTIAPTRLFD